MSSNLVIVAIPARDEKVWKVSSEKVPHLTLLHLGEDVEDVPKVQRIVDFVEHCVKANEHGSFMLDVDERGTLGDGEADVLFFRKDYSIKWIKQFRNQLLQQNDIRAPYESADQYPEWEPHLTLGYPESPANEDEIPEHGLNWISFDRIAVWTGDFEGPEFKLRWPEGDLDGCLAMSIANEERKAQGLEAVVEHFGTKGMRWGVRRAERAQKEADKLNRMADQADGKGVGPLKGKAASDYRKQAVKRQAVADKRFAKVDEKWAKNQFTLDKGIERHNAMADHFNSKIGPLNEKFKNDDFSKEPFEYPDHWSPRHKEYMQEVGKIENEAFRKAVTQVHGTSPSGKKKMDVALDSDGQTLRMVVKDVESIKHAAGDEVFLFRVTRDASGLITKVEPVEDSMSQTVARGAEALEHFGTKGMKWGVRKENVAAGAKAVGSGAKKVGRGLGKALDLASDVQFENMARDGRAAEQIEWKAHSAFHRTDLPKINAKPEYAAARKLRTRLRNPRDPIVKQYRQEVKSTYIKRLEEAANTTTNASGTRQYTIRERGWELPAEGGPLPTSRHFWEVSSRQIQHANNEDKPFYVELTLDQDGFVTDISPVDSSNAVHTIERGAEFIEHFGVKGMRWGQRKQEFLTKMHEKRVTTEAANREKRPAQDVRAYPTIGPSKRTHGQVDTKGGEDHPPTEDAIKVAVARQKLKKSGVDALTNTELRDVANRLNLEVQVTSLESKTARKSLGRQFIESLARDKETQRKLGDYAVKTAFKTAA